MTPEPGWLQAEANPQERGGRRRTNNSQAFRQEAMTRYQAMASRAGAIAMDTGESPITSAAFKEAFATLLPEMYCEHGGDGRLEIRRRSDNSVVNTDQLSSGEAEVVGLAVDILTITRMWTLDKASERILLLDEPDNHLHPDLLEQLGRFLVKLVDSEGVQVIVATHSTSLLAALGLHGGDRVGVAYLVRGAAETRAIPFDRYMKDLTTCLGGHALMGPLFSAPLLLVEGDDDVQIWSQVARFGRVRLAVLPFGGHPNVRDGQKTLEALFGALHAEPKLLGTALLDGDVSLPTVATHPQSFIQFCQLGCREAENLYLSDEVLASLDLTWDQAKEKIIADASKYGAQEAALLAVAECERKDHDLKSTIRSLSLILDPKAARWTDRVAKAIGTSRPTGQLETFLGPCLMERLWPAADELS